METNKFTFDFPEELGGQVMDITYWVERKNVQSALMYTDDMDDLTPIPVNLNAPEWKQHLDYLMPFLIERAEEENQ